MKNIRIFVPILLGLMICFTLLGCGNATGGGGGGGGSTTTYTLSVAVTPDGTGTVDANPSGWTYISGSTVELSASTLEGGWMFGSWEGDVSGKTSPLYVTMNSSKSIKAVFRHATTETFSLNVTVSPSAAAGSVYKSGSGPFADGARVILTAEANTGYVFNGWRGDLNGTDTIETITMNGNKNVTAEFQINEGAPFIADKWVSTTGADTATGSYSHPYRTIQYALNHALPGQTIGVMEGTYTEGIAWPDTNNITLEGVSEEGMIISGGGSLKCVNFVSLSTVTDATIRNMTINNGHTSGDNGAGIDFALTNATLHLYDVTISDNHASNSGGGVFLYGSSVSSTTIEAARCRFINNSCGASDYGGGIGIFYGTLILSSCEVSVNTAAHGGGIGGQHTGTLIFSSSEVTGNTASGNGGGIFLWDGNVQAERCKIKNNNAAWGGGIWTQATLTFSSCEVSGNTAGSSGGIVGHGGEIANCLIYNNRSTGAIGGIYCGASPMELINCTITSNESASVPGGIHRDGVINIVNCIVWGNTASSVTSEIDDLTNVSITYSDFDVNYAGTGNVNIDPQFVSVSDFHLSSSTSTDVTQGGTTEGAPDCDYEGNPRTAPYSMGAYEY